MLGDSIVRDASNQTLDSFTVDKELGKGSFGQVYLCTQKRTGRKVAIKVIHLKSMKPHEQETILREVRILREASRVAPSVIRLLEAFRSKETLFVVMDYVSGGDLSRLIAQCHSLPEKLIWKLAARMLQALAAIHSRNIIHRDIKPANILVDGDEFFLADLGLGRVMSESGLATTLCGTPYYMAPELMVEHPYDCRADIWSLGCVLYQCCVGQVPFKARSKRQLAIKILRKNVDAPIPSKYSSALINLIGRCLLRRAEERPQAETLLRDFAQFMPAPLPSLVAVDVPEPVSESDDGSSWIEEAIADAEHIMEQHSIINRTELDRVAALILENQTRESEQLEELKLEEEHTAMMRAEVEDAQAQVAYLQ